MGKYSNPQYLTLNGFVRSEKKPVLPTNFELLKEHIASKITQEEATFKMTPAKRHILRKRGITLKRRETEQKTLSSDAAKALAMALKGLLHS